MTSNQLTPEEEFSALSKQNNTLTVIEYLSAVASIAGTILAFFLNQSVFATTPLTLSICLNLFNRTTADRLMKKSADIDLIETQRAFASSLQSLRSKSFNVEFSGADGQDDSAPVLMLEDLAAKVQQLEAFLEIQGSDYYSQGGTLNQEVSILRNHQLEMAQAIETLTSELESRPEGGIEQHEVLDHLERLSAVVYDLEQKTATLQTNTQDGELPSAEEIDAARADLTALVEPIRAQISELEIQIHAASETPALDEDAIRGNLQSLLAPLEAQVSALEERVNTQPSSTDEEAQSPNYPELESLQGDVDVLNAKVDSSLAQLSTDIAGFQNVMQSTHEQMNGIHQQIEAIQSLAHDSAQSTNIEAIQSQIESANAPLREQYAAIEAKLNELSGLQGQLSDVQALAQTSANALNPDALRHFVDEANAPLRDQFSMMEQRLNAEPFAMQQKLEGTLTPIKSHLLDLEQRLKEALAQDPQANLLETIRPIQEQLNTLEHRLNELPAQQPDQSQQVQILQGQISDIQARLETVSNQVSAELSELPKLVEQNVEHRVGSLNLAQPVPEKNTENELDDLLKSLDI